MESILPGEHDLQGLLAQFQPTEADRKRARQQALMAASLSLLGRPKGAEYQSFGQAGLLGMGLYNNQLANIPKQRMDALKTYGALQDLINKQRMLKTSADILSDNSTPGMPSGAVGGGGMGGGAAGTFGLSSQPGSVSGQPSQMPIPTWKALMPREERALLAATGDPKLILESIQKYTKTERGPDGTVMTVTGVPLYKMTDAGVQFFAPNGMPSEFTPFPQGSTDAAARRTGAIEGAKEAATQAAKFPYQIDTAIGPSGAPRRGFATDLYGSPQAGGGSTTGRTITMDFPGGMSAADQAAVQRDIDRSGYAGMGFSMPSNRVVSGPDPLSQKAAESRIDTNAKLNTELGTGIIKQLDKTYETAYDAATKAIPSMHEARALLDSNKVLTGVGAPWALGFGRVLSQAGMGGDDYVSNTQTFIANQAKTVMSVIKQLGSGSAISNSDREYAALAQGGKIEANEQSLRKIIDIGERASRALIKSHNDRVGKASTSFQRQDLTDLYAVPMPDLYTSPQVNARPQMTGPDGQSQPLPNYGGGWSIRKLP